MIILIAIKNFFPSFFCKQNFIFFAYFFFAAFLFKLKKQIIYLNFKNKNRKF